MASPRASATTPRTGDAAPNVRDEAPPARVEHAAPPSIGRSREGSPTANEALIRARQDAGLTQDALARAVRCDVRTVQRWEREGMVPRSKRKQREVAATLKTTVETIFSQPTHAAPPPAAAAHGIAAAPEPAAAPQPATPPESVPGVSGSDIALNLDLLDHGRPERPRVALPALRLPRPGRRVIAGLASCLLVGLVLVAVLAGASDDRSSLATRAAAVRPLTPQQRINAQIASARQRGDYDQALTIARAMDDTRRVDDIKTDAVRILLQRADQNIHGQRPGHARTILDRSKHKYGDPVPTETAKRWARIHQLEAQAAARANAHADAKRRALAKRHAAQRARHASARAAAARSHPAPQNSTAPPSTTGGQSSGGDQSTGGSTSSGTTSSGGGGGASGGGTSSGGGSTSGGSSKAADPGLF